MRSDIADVLEYIRQRGPARTSKMGPFDLLFKNQWETIWRQSVTTVLPAVVVVVGRYPLSSPIASLKGFEQRISSAHLCIFRPTNLRPFWLTSP